jgi:superfamily I DNA/RNA helicase
VLFVGPHEPYLAYVSDVLPSLGEEGVQTCTLRDVLPEGAAARPEPDAEVARLKASADWVGAVDRAVRFYEETPEEGLEVSTPWADLWLSSTDWATAVAAVEPGTPHHEARDQVLDEVVEILVAKYEADFDRDLDADDSDGDGAMATPEQLRRAVLRDEDLLAALGRAWPSIDASDLVGDLWTVPAYLHLAAPWLTREEIHALQRPDAQAWTVSDLPILDLARQRLGDPGASARRRRKEAARAAEREERAKVVEHLIASDDSEMHVMSMLRGEDLTGALDDADVVPAAGADLLAGPFAHVVVDEAQELTDAEWQMLLARCPSRSLTVVGDRAQARHGFTETWQERLGRVGLDRVTLASLTVNYRTPSEVMAQAEPVIRAVLPDANVPTSVRDSGRPVVHGTRSDLEPVLAQWLDAHAEGVACVIGDASFAERPRVRSLTPELAKGLEFDLVVLVEPERFGTGIEGAVDRYVAMTRATQQLVVLEG